MKEQPQQSDLYENSHVDEFDVREFYVSFYTDKYRSDYQNGTGNQYYNTKRMYRAMEELTENLDEKMSD